MRISNVFQKAILPNEIENWVTASCNRNSEKLRSHHKSVSVSGQIKISVMTFGFELNNVMF